MSELMGTGNLNIIDKGDLSLTDFINRHRLHQRGPRLRADQQQGPGLDGAK